MKGPKRRYARSLRKCINTAKADLQRWAYSIEYGWRQRTQHLLTRSVKFSGRTLWLANKPLELEHPIADALETRGVAIVLFEYDSAKNWPLSNLSGLDLSGRKLWTAELPPQTHFKGDVYLSPAHLRRPLQFVSFSSFICTLNPATGRIIATEFTK